MARLDFSETSTAFAYKSTADLRKAQWMFRMLDSSIGRFGQKAMQVALKLGLPIKPIVKATLYSQFVGGETLESCKRTIEKLAIYKVKSLLDYSVEGEESEAAFEKATAELLRNISFAGSHPDVPFSVFKVTALAPTALLQRVSEGKGLNAAAKDAWLRVEERVEKLCSLAEQLNVPLMFDAEETWIQPAIDGLALRMMRAHNQQAAIVINTYQLYIRGKALTMEKDMDAITAEGLFFGAKLVRGAYMEKERARAEDKEYPSPINTSKPDTDEEYDRAVRVAIEGLPKARIVIGTHNEESCRLAATECLRRGYPLNHPHLWFSQLLGMSDNISFNLAAEGANVVKYVPYGPVRSVTPYLIRRAQENTSVGGQTNRELALIEKELLRRAG